MQNVAQSWLVYRLTGSSLLLGVVSFAGQIPVFLLSPAGGLVADRRSRHQVIIATQISSMALALVLAALTLAHRVQVWHVMVLAALLGLVNAFDLPARQAFLVEMVGKQDLMNAIALNSSMFNGARIVGPAIAGLLVASVGEGWCFLVNAISYIAVIAGLFMMQVQPLQWVKRTGSALEHTLEGFRFVRDTAPIRALLLLVGVISLVAMPYAVLMPIFAANILHGGAKALGILMGASGVGAMLGALTLAMRKSLRGLGNWVAASSAVFGVSLLLFSFSRNFWLSAALLVPAGFAMMFQMSSSNTLVQAMVPDALRGRVMAAYSMMFMGMAPIGALAAGSVANRFGAPHTVAFGSLLAIVAAIVFRLQLPYFRGEARELIIAQGLAGGDPAQEMNIPRT